MPKHNLTSTAEGWSLERRLLAGLSAVLVLVAVVLFFVVGSYARRAADDAHDRLLLASALSIADAVRLDAGRIAIDLPYASLAILGTSPRDRVFYRIAAPDGAALTGYADLAPGVPPARSDTPRFLDLGYRDATARAVVLGRFVAGQGGGWVTIIVAQTRLERTALAQGILTSGFGSVLAVLVLAMLLIAYGVRRALEPLRQLEALIRDREPHDLRPIEAPAPDELRVLLAALNGFMGRLQASLGHMRSFVADASHQIRNPLASLRAQAELAVEEEEPEAMRTRVANVLRSAVQASQLTNQLLSHAMIAYRTDQARRERVDLAVLARQVARRVETGAETATIEVDLEDLEAPAIVEGDPVMLGEALTNLLDNAVKYAGEAGPIGVRLLFAEAGRRLRLEVADHGPGIPTAERAQALERFGRGSATRHLPGSGLGLAIVREVASAHGGDLTLHDRPGGGLLVRFDLPAAPAERRSRKAAAVAGTLAILIAGDAAAADRLRLYAATDPSVMIPLIADFEAANPEVTVDYEDLNTNELHARLVSEPPERSPDIVISSAMDLQVQLVNDGWTQPHVSPATRALPAWANWRDEAFGFTYERIVLIARDAAFTGRPMPRSHQDLLRLLQEPGSGLTGRIATYDPAASGVGYLLVTQDSVLSSQFWPLATAMGRHAVRLFPASALMLDAMVRGEVDLGYNILGSYALAHAMAGAGITVIAPEDYTLVMARVAVIPKRAPRPDLARAFIDYLLSPRGQDVIDRVAGVTAITRAPGEAAGGADHPIRLGTALLVFLDAMKRAQFLANWQAATGIP